MCGLELRCGAKARGAQNARGPRGSKQGSRPSKSCRTPGAASSATKRCRGGPTASHRLPGPLFRCLQPHKPCCALASALLPSHLPMTFSCDWLQSMDKAVQKIVEQCDNLKVRSALPLRHLRLRPFWQMVRWLPATSLHAPGRACPQLYGPLHAPRLIRCLVCCGSHATFPVKQQEEYLLGDESPFLKGPPQLQQQRRPQRTQRAAPNRSPEPQQQLSPTRMTRQRSASSAPLSPCRGGRASRSASAARETEGTAVRGQRQAADDSEVAGAKRKRCEKWCSIGGSGEIDGTGVGAHGK